MATCHAHGDGSWSIAFTAEGQEELRNCEAAATDSPQLDVDVRSEIKGGFLYHHGEMKNKPQACQRYVALNNDDVHREHQADTDGQHDVRTKLNSANANARGPDAKTMGNGSKSYAGRNGAPSVNDLSPTPWSHSQRGRPPLAPEQTQLATDLARDGLTKKEERLLFAQLRAIPWEQQEQILKQSKLLKSDSTKQERD